MHTFACVRGSKQLPVFHRNAVFRQFPHVFHMFNILILISATIQTEIKGLVHSESLPPCAVASELHEWETVKEPKAMRTDSSIKSCWGWTRCCVCLCNSCNFVVMFAFHVGRVVGVNVWAFCNSFILPFLVCLLASPPWSIPPAVLCSIITSECQWHFTGSFPIHESKTQNRKKESHRDKKKKTIVWHPNTASDLLSRQLTLLRSVPCERIETVFDLLNTQTSQTVV